MINLNEYENDLAFNVMVKRGIGKNSLLEFIFKKGGKVNVTSMTHLLLSAGRFNSNLSKSISELISDGLLKCWSDECEYCSVTIKAKWIRLYSNPAWQFWAAVGTIVAVLLSLIAICRG